MAYKEPHFDKAGIRAFMGAMGATNADMARGAKKSPAKGTSKPSAKGKK